MQRAWPILLSSLLLLISVVYVLVERAFLSPQFAFLVIIFPEKLSDSGKVYGQRQAFSTAMMSPAHRGFAFFVVSAE